MTQDSASPALFDAIPRLCAQVSWRELGQFPTRVHAQPDLLPSAIDLWLKREDESSDVYGGNKVRKLEFVLADAAARGMRRIVTIGRYGSHHVLATGVWGTHCGFDVEGLVIPQLITSHVLENLLADAAIGIRLRPKRSFMAAFASLLASSLRPGTLAVRGGASNALGNLGYVSAALELAAQVRAGECPSFDDIYLPLGSGGSVAGLWLGQRLAGMNARVVGVEVVRRRRTSSLAHVLRLAHKTNAKYGLGVNLSEPGLDLVVDGRLFAPGYGTPNPQVTAAIEMASAVGIELELTYSGRAFAALVADADAGLLDGRKVLFIHTYNSADMQPLLARSPGPAGLPDELARLFERAEHSSDRRAVDG